MKSIAEFKEKAEFFKAGSIVPQRVAKVTPRKASYMVVFGSDSWVLPAINGYVVAVNTADKGTALYVKNKFKNIKIKINGSPYGVGTFFMCNAGLSDGEWLSSLNEKIEQLKGDLK